MKCIHFQCHYSTHTATQNKPTHARKSTVMSTKTDQLSDFLKTRKFSPSSLHEAEDIAVILLYFVHHDMLSEEDYNKLKQVRILSFLHEVLEPKTFEEIRKIIKPVHNKTEKEEYVGSILKHLKRYGACHPILKTNEEEREKQIAKRIPATMFKSGCKGAISSLQSAPKSWMPPQQETLGSIITMCKHPITHTDVAIINPKWKTAILTAWNCKSQREHNLLKFFAIANEPSTSKKRTLHKSKPVVSKKRKIE